MLWEQVFINTIKTFYYSIFLPKSDTKYIWGTHIGAEGQVESDGSISRQLHLDLFLPRRMESKTLYISAQGDFIPRV